MYHAMYFLDHGHEKTKDHGYEKQYTNVKDKARMMHSHVAVIACPSSCLRFITASPAASLTPLFTRGGATGNTSFPRREAAAKSTEAVCSSRASQMGPWGAASMTARTWICIRNGSSIFSSRDGHGLRRPSESKLRKMHPITWAFHLVCQEQPSKNKGSPLRRYYSSARASLGTEMFAQELCSSQSLLFDTFDTFLTLPQTHFRLFKVASALVT
jgi:hypothetical protein